jgi:hypothetical protein
MIEAFEDDDSALTDHAARSVQVVAGHVSSRQVVGTLTVRKYLDMMTTHHS